MLKVTIKFILLLSFLSVVFSISLPGCNSIADKNPEPKNMHLQDSLSEARIDSAYAAIKNACDTALLHVVPRLTDSLMKGDTAYLEIFFNSTSLYNDADKKVEKVVRLLKADCDSNLLKETYKRAQHLQKAMRVRHKKLKA